MLSGVLLMSSLPVQVRAEEEIFEDLDSMITETQLMMDLEEELNVELEIEEKVTTIMMTIIICIWIAISITVRIIA